MSEHPEPMQRLLEIMARLRDPQDGCPWDLQQSYASIVRHTIEEAYEVAEAIENGDFDDLRDELGDLLFQVVFYAQIAHEEGRFDFNDVVAGICDKMVRRHPHVFGDEDYASEEEQRRAWEAIKATERADKKETQDQGGLLASIPEALPALTRAHKLQRKAAHVGFDWPGPAGVLKQLDEERTALVEAMAEGDPQRRQARLEQEMGDLLFTCVNLARHLKVDPEGALRKCNRNFTRRFQRMEQILRERDERIDALASDPEALARLWETAERGLVQHPPSDHE